MARSLELDKEIARLQSEKQLVVDEQATVVGFYNNAMTMLEEAAKACNVPTHSAAAAAPSAVPVQLSMPPAELANNVQTELSKQKEDLAKRFQADTQGQQLSNEQLLNRALEFALGMAASSAVCQIASQTLAPPANSAPSEVPGTPAGLH